MTEFQRQKEEAAQRVLRMSERYRQKMEEAPPAKPPTVRKEPQTNPMDILKMFRFDSIKNDPDRLIIICVFLLLGQEKCDEKLLYALLYIML